MMIGVNAEREFELPPVTESQMRENQDAVWAEEHQCA